MNKKVNNEKEINKDEDVVNKLLKLGLLYSNENSKNWINLVNHQIKGYEIQKQHLIDNKPLFFQKKKLEEHNKKIEEIDNKIMKCLKDIEEELNFMESNNQIINN